MKETQKIALFHALKCKDLSSVQMLATQDVSLLSSPLGHLGLYPIHVAVQQNDQDMIDYFISQAIDVNPAIYAPSYPEQGKTSLYFATELGYIDVIRQLVNAVPKPVQNKEYLLLHVAARMGRRDIIEYLFESYFDRDMNSLFQIDSTGQMPFHLAARHGYVHTLDFYHWIISQMHSVYFYASKDEQKTIFFDNNLSLSIGIKATGTLDHGKTALNLAVEQGHLPCVQMLLENNVIFQPESKIGRHLIHTAALHGHLEIVQYYIKEYPCALNEGLHGLTPLLWAARGGHVLVVEYLIAMGATFDQAKNSQDSQYKTSPLYWAVRNGHVQVVKKLIEAGAVADLRCGNMKYLFLHLAVQEGHLEIVQLLLAQFPHWLNKTDAKEQTALLWASSMGHTEIVDHLLSLGADFNKGTKGDPMYWAVQGGHTPIVKRLIDASLAANIKIKSMDYRLIDIAVRKGHLEIIHFLLEMYPHWLNEAFPRAAMVGDIDLVECLLSFNPDIDNSTFCGKTARDWAIRRGHFAIVDRLDIYILDMQNKTTNEAHPLEPITSYYKFASINRCPSFFKQGSVKFSPNKSLGDKVRDFISAEGQHVVIEKAQRDPKQLEHQICLMQKAYPEKGFYTWFHCKSMWSSKQNDTGRIVSPYLTGESANVYLEKVHSIDDFIYTLRLMAKELMRLHEQGIILNNIKLDKIIISSNSDELHVTYTGFKHARDINDAKAPMAPDIQNRHVAPELVKVNSLFSLQPFSTLKPSYSQDVFSFGYMLNEILYSHPLGAQAAESFPSILAFIRKALDKAPRNRPTIQSLHESLKSDCLISTPVDDDWEICFDSFNP